jgi:hypothetical protein
MKNTTKRVLSAVAAVMMIVVCILTVASCSKNTTYKYSKTSYKILLDGKENPLFKDQYASVEKVVKENMQDKTMTVTNKEVIFKAADGKESTVQYTKKDGKLVVQTNGSVADLLGMENMYDVEGYTFDVYFVEKSGVLTLYVNVNIATGGQQVTLALEIEFTKA